MSKSNDSMTAKRDNQNPININYKFLKYTFYSFIVAVVFSIVAIIVTQADFPKLDGQTLVGITTLLLTLPVTWAAAYVVIQLGVRMDALAHNAEAREIKQAFDNRVAESYQSSRDVYIESFNHLKNIAQILSDAHAKLTLSFIDLSLAQHEITGWSGEKYFYYVESNEGTKGPRADAIFNFTKIQVKKILDVRNSLLEKIDLLVTEAWRFNHDYIDHISVLDSFYGEMINRYESERDNCQNNYNELKLEGRDKSILKRTQNECDSAANAAKAFLTLKDLNNNKNKGVVRSLVQMKILLSLVGDADEELFRKNVEAYIEGYLKGEYRPQEAATMFLGWAICPKKFDRLVPVYAQDEDQSGEIEVRHEVEIVKKNLFKKVNNIGLIAIEDFLKTWPDKQNLINSIIDDYKTSNIVNEDVKNEVKIKLKNNMPTPCDLVFDLRNYVLDTDS